MKKNIIVFLLIIAGLSSSQAQHDVKINVLGLAYKNYSASYEYVLNSKSGLNLTVGYFTTPKILKGLIRTGYSATGISLEYRYYLSENENEATGLWIAPYLKYSRKKFKSIPADFDTDSTTVDIPITDYISSKITPGMAFGVKFDIENILLGIYFGTGMAVHTGKYYSNTGLTQEQIDFLSKLDSKWQLRLGINIGYRFRKE